MWGASDPQKGNGFVGETGEIGGGESERGFWIEKLGSSAGSEDVPRDEREGKGEGSRCSSYVKVRSKLRKNISEDERWRNFYPKQWPGSGVTVGQTDRQRAKERTTATNCRQRDEDTEIIKSHCVPAVSTASSGQGRQRLVD